MENNVVKPMQLSDKIVMTLKVVCVNNTEINVHNDKEYKKRLVLFTNADDALYPEFIEIEFVAEDRIASLSQLGAGDIVNVTSFLRGRMTEASPGKQAKIWNRFHGLNWEIVHKKVQSAGTLQAGAAAANTTTQAPASNEQNLNQLAGFNTPPVTAPADDLPF